MQGRTVILAVVLYLTALYVLPDECPECGRVAMMDDQR